MAKVVGDIAVEVSADIGPLQRGLREGSKDIKGFGANTARVAKNVAKAGAVMAGGLAVAAGGAFTLVKNAADAGAEIENLARIANTTPEKFQKMAAAARTVGVEQDKLADILKDVQDRIGDFLSTGGGPMADFFEKVAPQVGVTAEQFKNLSGPQALQLYMTSLQRANLSQDEMTFYMEAMASDLTALQPLLANGGKEMRRLGDEAAAAGAIMSNEAVNGSSQLRAELENISKAISTQFTEAILENKDEILELTDQITNVWIPALIKAAGAITTIVDLINKSIEGYRILGDLLDDGVIHRPLTDEQTEGRNELDGQVRDSINNRLPESLRTNPMQGGGGGLFDGLPLPGVDGFEGGSKMDFLADQNEQEFELQNEHLERMRELFQEFSDGRFEMLSEAYDRERELNKAHNDAIEQQDRLSMRTKLNMVSGAFGDLASLMASENKKMFEIGKAAAIAEAVVSGYSAAVEAWEKGMKVGGPPVAAAFTAMSIARTAGLISSISSTSYGGGAAGGAGAFGGMGGATAAPAAPVNEQYYTVNMTGEGPIGRDGVRGLIQQLNEAIDDGAVLKGIVVNG